MSGQMKLEGRNKDLGDGFLVDGCSLMPGASRSGPLSFLIILARCGSGRRSAAIVVRTRILVWRP